MQPEGGGTLSNVLQCVASLEIESLAHSALDGRERRDRFKDAHSVVSALLRKIVSSSKVEHGRFLLQHIKRLYPKGGHMKIVVEDLKSLNIFSILDKVREKTTVEIIIKFSI